MGWFDILKVEDIAFDKDLQAFGAYSLEKYILILPKYQWLLRGLWRKAPELKDLVEEKIRINHKAIYEHLKRKLKESLKKEIEDVIRTIMHEATHAGMGTEQFTMSPQASEYGAITGQFPQNTYYRLKTFLKHPDSQENTYPMFDAIGLKQQLEPTG